MSATAQAPALPPTRLRGVRLALARVAWVLAVGLVLAGFAALLPAYYQQLGTVCAAAGCAPAQPSPEGARALAGLGISLGVYATTAFAITVGATLVATGIGCLMALRRPDDWLVLLNAFVVVPLGTASATYAIQESHAPASLLALVLNIVTFAAFFVATGLFPDGRFVPRWSGLVALVWVFWGAFYLEYRERFPLSGAHTVVWLACCGTLLAVQLYRFRFVSTGPQRQQTKWILLGGGVTVVTVALAQVPRVLDPAMNLPGSLYQLLTEPISQLMDLVFIVSIGIAIVRYRLFDVDLIIKRALVYGTLTLSLAALYFGAIVSLQLLLQRVLGQASGTPALVISTLAIAALVQPWRRRLQRAIDRRFYRQRYSATRIIMGFAATVRTELDLNDLRERLEGVVDEAMQPAHISLWLRANPAAPDERG